MAKTTEQELMMIQAKLDAKIKLTREEKKILKDNDKEAKEKKKNMSFGERMKLASKNEFAQLMGDNEEDKYATRDYICTGNWLLNAQISGDPFKGLGSARQWQLAGVNSSGKTFLMRKTVSNAQKMGYFFALLETEGANNDKSELKQSGIDTENMLLVPTPTVEEMATSLCNMVEDVNIGDKLIIGIDSLGNTSTLKEIEDIMAGDDTADMTRARKIRGMFRAFSLKASLKNIPVIILNHTYAVIGGFGGRETGGGDGPKYNSSIINIFTKAQIQEKDNLTGKTIITGACITSKAEKCRTAKEKTQIKFDIDFDEGLTLDSGMLQYCLDEKLLIKVKQSYVFNKDKVGKESWFTEKEIGPSKITIDFWKKLLDDYLAEYLRRKFKYQSSTEGLVTEEDLMEILDMEM